MKKITYFYKLYEIILVTCTHMMYITKKYRIQMYLLLTSTYFANHNFYY